MFEWDRICDHFLITYKLQYLTFTSGISFRHSKFCCLCLKNSYRVHNEILLKLCATMKLLSLQFFIMNIFSHFLFRVYYLMGTLKDVALATLLKKYLSHGSRTIKYECCCLNFFEVSSVKSLWKFFNFAKKCTLTKAFA